MMNIKFFFLILLLFLITGIFSASAATVSLDIPPDITRGQMFNINVIIDPKGEHIAGVQLDLEFNKSSISLNSITEGNFLKKSGINTYFDSGTINNANGKAVNINGAILGQGNVTTSGIFIIISATSIESINSADINLKNVLVVDPKGEQIYPIPSPKPVAQTETISSALGEAPEGVKTGGAKVGALPEPESSNKNIFIAALAGILLLSMIVYKYVVPKYSASKGVVSDIGNKKKIVKTIRKN